MHSLEAFLDSISTPHSPKKGLRITPQQTVPGFTNGTNLNAYTNNPISGVAAPLRHPITWTTDQAPQTQPINTLKRAKSMSLTRG